MVGAEDINGKIDVVQELLRQKLGLRKRALPAMMQRAGRRLPRRMQGQVETLLQAQALSQNPKLAKQVDTAAVARAYDDITAHLRMIDVAERRKDAILGIAGTIAFNLLLIVFAFVTWLWWRGFV